MKNKTKSNKSDSERTNSSETKVKKAWERPVLVRLGTIRSVALNMDMGSVDGGMLDMS